MTQTLLRLVDDEEGATAIEYGLIAALIAVALITAFIGFGSSLSAMFNYVSNRATTVWSQAS
jgi:pilus assembly protein Flp/PilA